MADLVSKEAESALHIYTNGHTTTHAYICPVRPHTDEHAYTHVWTPHTRPPEKRKNGFTKEGKVKLKILYQY